MSKTKRIPKAKTISKKSIEITGELPSIGEVKRAIKSLEKSLKNKDLNLSQSLTIPKVLLPGFDQNGKFWNGWSGWRWTLKKSPKERDSDFFEGEDEERWRPDKIDTEVVKNLIIPKSQRESYGVLNTSFVHLCKSPCNIEYEKICGELRVVGTSNFQASNLRHIVGKARIEVSERVAITLPELELCQWDFLTTSRHFQAPKLQEVRGMLVLNQTNKVCLPQLKCVDSNLLAWENTKVLDLPKLQSIGGDLYASNARDIKTPKLSRVAGNFIAYGIEELSIPSLSFVGAMIRCPSNIYRFFRTQCLEHCLIHPEFNEHEEAKQEMEKELTKRHILRSWTSSQKALVL